MKKNVVIAILLLATIVLFAMVQSKPEVSKQSCVGCGDYVNYCPVQAISLQNGKAVIDTDVCIDCKMCITTCTYNAIK